MVSLFAVSCLRVPFTQSSLHVRRIDAASLAAFRILFGLLMAVSTVRFMALGWVDEFYVQPAFHFTWDPFPWVTPLPAPLMHLLFVALAVLALAIAAGFHYRLCMALFFIGFTYVELIDKTYYLNHYYLVSLLSGLMIFLPANTVWSLDTARDTVLTLPTLQTLPTKLLSPGSRQRASRTRSTCRRRPASAARARARSSSPRSRRGRTSCCSLRCA